MESSIRERLIASKSLSIHICRSLEFASKVEKLTPRSKCGAATINRVATKRNLQNSILPISEVAVLTPFISLNYQSFLQNNTIPLTFPLKSIHHAIPTNTHDRHPHHRRRQRRIQRRNLSLPIRRQKRSLNRQMSRRMGRWQQLFHRWCFSNRSWWP